MKTPESRVRFQAPSRHYHRHRVEDENEAWDRWIGDRTRKGKGKIQIVAVWILAVAAFLTVVGTMCYQMI